MTLRSLLARSARAEARGRAAAMAWSLALLGLLSVSVALFAERAGFDLPFLRLPEVQEGAGLADRVIGFVAISTAGLIQGAVFCAVVVAAAILVRLVAAPLLRRKPAAIASRLDHRLFTERFSAALEAAGPLAPLVEHEALSDPPPPELLAPRRGARRKRFLAMLALALVLVVAVLPGIAPGEEGDAAVLGAPDPGQKENLLRLTLAGPTGKVRQGGAIPLSVLGQTKMPPRRDLELPTTFVLDDQIRIESGQSLFMPAGAPGEDTVRFNLAGALPKLKPGKHRVFALAGGARSNVWEFEIEGEPGGGGGKKDKKKQEKKKEPKPNKQQGGALPELKPRFVEPLVREGDKVEKRARVPIEVPGGGAPKQSSIQEAWPELERRKEAALNRAGLSPSARELVRTYFDTLDPTKPAKKDEK
ncbi:MAG: hypothetical protein ACYTGZ_08300 [Planctomycetota bacterium]|jgi:hypothetical protein